MIDDRSPSPDPDERAYPLEWLHSHVTRDGSHDVAPDCPAAEPDSVIDPNAYPSHWTN